MNRTTSRGSNNSITGKVRMYEQAYYRVCKKRTTSRGSKASLVRYVCMNRPTIEYVRKGPQVECVKKDHK